MDYRASTRVQIHKKQNTIGVLARGTIWAFVGLPPNSPPQPEMTLKQASYLWVKRGKGELRAQ